MYILLNNETNYPIEFTTFQFNYLSHSFHIKQEDFSKWSSSLLNFITELKQVTSIKVINEDKVVREYNDLDGQIQFVNDSIEYRQNTLLTSMNINIFLNET